jgi:hypothetical protein
MPLRGTQCSGNPALACAKITAKNARKMLKLKLNFEIENRQ